MVQYLRGVLESPTGTTPIEVYAEFSDNGDFIQFWDKAGTSNISLTDPYSWYLWGDDVNPQRPTYGRTNSLSSCVTEDEGTW